MEISFSFILKKEQKYTGKDAFAALQTPIRQFENAVRSTFLHQKVATELKQVFNHGLDMLRKNGETPLTRETATVLQSLPQKIIELTEFCARCRKESWERLIIGMPINASFRKIYQLYWDYFKFCLSIDSSFVVDFLALISAHSRDMQTIKPMLSKALNGTAVNEVEEFIRQSGKSADLTKYKLVSLEQITDKWVRFSARDEKNAKDCSIEIFSPTANSTDFVHKYSIIRHIDHPSIVGFVDSVHFAPFALVISPLNLPTLAETLFNTPEKLSSTQLSIIAFEIARSLEYLHAHHYVHCQLSLDSIYLTKANLPLLYGFDYAQQKSPTMACKIPFNSYSAAETLIEPISFNEKIDVYSFAIMLSEMLQKSKNSLSKLNDAELQENILLYDSRPEMTTVCPFSDVLISCWSRNPELRPSFENLVQIMSHGAILFPETSAEEFNQYVASTTAKNDAALKGLLTITPESLLDMARTETDEYVIEIVVNVLNDTQSDRSLIDSALDVYVKYIKTKTDFIVSELVTLVNLFPVLPDVEELVVEKIKHLDDLQIFIKMLCERLPSDLSVPFYVKHLLNDERAADFLLEFCAKKSDDIALYAAEAVANRFPESESLYKAASLNNIYYKCAFHLLANSSVDHMRKYFKYIQDFSQLTPVSFAPVLSRVFKKIGASICELDENGVLMLRLVKGGFTQTLVSLTSDKVLAKIVLNYVIPGVTSRPVDCLRLIVAVDKTPQLRQQLYEFDVISIVLATINEGQIEYAGAAMAALHIPDEVLKKNIDFAHQIVELFSKIDDVFCVSALLSVLTPFIMKGVWIELQILPTVVSKLIKSNQTVVASRALLCGVSLAQRPRVAKIFATSDNIEATRRFIGCGDRNFEYVALRFLAAMAPFITPSCDINSLIDSLASVCDDERRAIIGLSVATLIPKEYRKDVAPKFSQVAQEFPGQTTIQGLYGTLVSE